MSGVREDEGYEVIERRREYEGSVVSISTERFRLPNGVECEHDLLELPDVVAIVPLREDTDGRPLVVLVEQLRHAVGGFIHEIPAGHIEAGEDPLESARRELEEETGYRADRWTGLASRLTIPGVSNQRMHYFLAEGLHEGEQRLEDEECLVLRELPLEVLAREILDDACDEPRVVDAKTHIGVLHVAVLRLGREILSAPGGQEGHA